MTSLVCGRVYAELKSEDFRAVYHLLGECSELWLDPAAWQDHLLATLSRLIHLPIGMRAELDDFTSTNPPRILEAREHGWPDTASQKLFATKMRQNGPFTSAPLDSRFRQLVSHSGNVTLARADLVADREWHRSETFNLAHRPAGMHEMLYSARRTGGGRVHLLGFGGAGHRPSKRDCQLLDLAHHELLPLLRTRLTSEGDYSLHRLSPRRREIYALVVAGLPEKQIADRLGIRPSSVNEQMQELYAHFGVHSRAGLMAYVLARRPLQRPNGGSSVDA